MGGNPINRVDPSGMCWANPGASPEQQSQCFDAWSDYAEIVTDTFTQSWPRDVQILMTQEARYWSGLSYNEFVNEWNGPRPPGQTGSGTNLQSAGGVMVLQGLGITQLDSPAPGPADAVGIPWAIVGLCVVGIGAVIGVTQGTTGTLAQRPLFDFGAPVFEYRLNGFNRKVGTLAEHLAKLLERDVAGYPPSDPNPNRDPDGGWCRTIRRVIQEIDNTGYSQRQLSRDLEAAGFAGGRWSEIISALREVIERGLCDDHWGDFDGGSLATG